MLRRRTVTTACALAIGVITLMAAPTTAEADTGTTDAATTGSSVTGSSVTAIKPPPGMLDAMQRDLGLSADQAQARLLNESRAAAVESKLRKRLRDAFAGSWVTGDTSSTLVIATTDASEASAISASGARPQVVGRTLASLTAAKEALDRAAASAAPKSTPIWYIDVRTNSVVVLTSQPAEAEAFIAASGVDKSAVRVEQSAEQPRVLYDARGGDAYYINSSARCSIGFSVTRGGQGGFVSAGHCGNAGDSTAGFNRVAQGTFQASSFPTNDYSWVALNSSWTPQPWVNNGSGGNVTVSGSTVAVEGASICRSGSTTGWHCGTVQQRNTSVTYAEGTVYEVTRTNVCAEPGDSGGSFISGSQAQGVTSGGSGNCTSGGTTYFQPVNEILSVYGLTLVTSGGNPPPTGCSGYQQTFSGSLTSGASAYQPNGSYYQSTVSGTHSGCLDGPDSVDFDLYLQKWNGSTWVNVASGTSSGPDETVTYSGTAGYYRYRVHAYSGSGSYTMGLSKP
ncbi:S1 family peptidase [Planotetraspora sp. A-T 1434]|uniref:S1 family peptidase n=1 Tax=Planotetraspora sp. A-T 1434 TaxID=2979219 RepID=UPI0021BF5CE7|nr:S1 family peptidase [Planotetraspora sp. A-T 1434]MCT9928912.1 S1 family peptidase [Planotetraspora sp. A-T 1434]